MTAITAPAYVFHSWPEHDLPGIPRGPLYEEQRLIWFDKLSPEKRKEIGNLGFPKGHDHPVSYDLLQGGKGSGKCYGRATPILLYDGSIKPVEEIRVGDQLMGPDSKPRLVTSLARGREKMYKVVPTKGEPFVCNESHILVLKTSGKRVKNLRIGGANGYRKEIISTGEIVKMTAGEFARLSAHEQNCHKLFHSEAVEFPNPQRLRIDPYFMGIWLADGSKQHPSVTTMDPEIVEYLYLYAEEIGLTIRYETGNGAHIYHLTSGEKGGGAARNPISAEMFYLNLKNNKHIPLDYKTASKEDRFQLLAGLIDGDGYLGNDYYEITQKLENLAHDIAFLARSLGFMATVVPVKKSCTYKGEKREGDYFRVSIHGDINLIPVRIPRKKHLTPHSDFKDAKVTGLKLEDLGEGDYYGFTLDGPDRMHLLGDFKVGHNTICAVARCIECALYHEGCEILVGARDLPILERSAKNEWRKRFTLPGGKEWAHPLVIRRPTDKDKRLIVRTWTMKCGRCNNKGCWHGKPSVIWFLHFDDDEALRGVNADIIHIEEAALIKDKASYMELLTRLRGRACPFRQVILTTNPEHTRGWLSEVFCLHQFTPSYKGPQIPIGDPCKCHLCQTCLNFGKGEWTFEGGKCSNPDCAFKQYTPEGKNPEDYRAKKESSCPGGQYYHRVIFVATHMNPALPSDAVQTMLGGMDKATARSAIWGEQVYLTEGKVFSAFDPLVNILDTDREYDLNPEEPAIFTLDFNVNPQCSIICQEKSDPDGNEYLVGLDEFILWKSNEQDVGEAVAKYLKARKFTSTIYIYGDPNGLNGDVKNNLGQYKAIFDVLKREKIKYKMMVPDNTPMSVLNTVQNANAIFCNAKGESRFFINSRCKWTIKSIEETEWDENGRNLINKRMDKDAYKRAKENDFHMDPNTPLPLTHPGEAIRYCIALRYPELIKKRARRLVQIPGEVAIHKSQSGETKESSRKKKSKFEDPFKPKSLRGMVQDSHGVDLFDSSGTFNLFRN